MYCYNVHFKYAYEQRGRDQLCMISWSIAQNALQMRICVPYIGTVLARRENSGSYTIVAYKEEHPWEEQCKTDTHHGIVY